MGLKNRYEKSSVLHLIMMQLVWSAIVCCLLSVPVQYWQILWKCRFDFRRKISIIDDKWFHFHELLRFARSSYLIRLSIVLCGTKTEMNGTGAFIKWHIAQSASF